MVQSHVPGLKIVAYWPALPRWGKVVIGVVMLAGVAGAIQWDPGVGPLLRPAIDRFLPFGGINKRLPFWYDPQHWAYYDQALRWQFVTFWSAFGNGVPGLPRAPLAALLILSGLAATGLVKSWKKSPVSEWQVRGLAFLALAVLAAFMMSLLRIDNPRPTSYIPTARHFYVAIVPVVLLLLLGWGAWLPAESRKVGLVGMVLGLYALVTWSILNVQIPWFAANWPIPFP